jgi:hypothetical protein
MVRKKTAVAEAAQEPQEQDVFDQAIAAQQAAEAAAATPPLTEAPATPPTEEQAAAHIANPSSRPTTSHAETVGKRQSKLPPMLNIPAGDTLVQLIDKGDNQAGIGIRIAFLEGAKNRPTEEEKAIIRRHVKGEEGEPTGFTWKRDLGMWHKPIVRPGENPHEVPPSRPVAIRLDAERRVKDLADDLKQLQADPVGYAERLRLEREQAAQREPIPD